MSHGFGKRVERLEDALVIGEDRQEFERLRRMHYNLINVSDEALTASIDAIQQGDPTPDWAEEEFQKPIPADAHQWQVRNAERNAKEEMRIC